ncbi:MAG: PAC2 family protein, partial [Candidatus Woesearchaeota archaeon]
MDGFRIHKVMKSLKVSKPVLIEGLPGIGNVGKVAADFIIDSLKAKKVLEIHSYHFPHSVFINEKNLIELPIIELYHKKIK